MITNSDGLRNRLGSKLADHHSLLFKVPDAVEVRELSSRKIMYYNKVNWDQMKDIVARQDWSFLQNGSVDDMLVNFNAFLSNLVEAYVPVSWSSKVKSTLPWMNKSCIEAIASKHAAEDTDSYAAKASACQTVLREAHQAHLSKVKSGMDQLPRGSKQWWSLAKQLMHKKSSTSIFPPIKDVSGVWRRDAEGKANAFATCWKAKNRLPPESHELPFFQVPSQILNLNVIRTRNTCRELSKLRLDQATGPDLIAAIFLRRLSKELALPVAVIARRIFREGWPSLWRVHWLIPLFKRFRVRPEQISRHPFELYLV